MTIAKQYERFRSRIMDDIVFVSTHKAPEGWLPFDTSAIVFPDCDDIREYPILEHCRIENIFDNRECSAITFATGDTEPYGLGELLTEHLIALLQRYCQLSVQQGIWKENALAYMEEHTTYSKAEIARLVDAHWNPDLIPYDNLEALTIPY